MTPNESQTPAVEAIPLRRSAADLGLLLTLACDAVETQARRLGVSLSIRVDPTVPETLHFDQNKVAWAVTNLGDHFTNVVITIPAH